ncbi:hypothetical protein Y032_1055g3505 [Ancylostoma ceylanicum]|nr:hypothetical protein Y032_1055g3505 [Ancylostoma ceylanicum]
MTVASNPTAGRARLPRNCVKFEVDPRMSKRDIRDYLSKIYKLPVRDVRTEVCPTSMRTDSGFCRSSAMAYYLK